MAKAPSSVEAKKQHFFEPKGLSDLCFVDQDGHEHFVHKMILARRCKFFQRLPEEMCEKIVLSQYTTASLSCFLEAVYGCESILQSWTMPLLSEVLLPIWQLAERYEFAELQLLCENDMARNLHLYDLDGIVRIVNQCTPEHPIYPAAICRLAAHHLELASFAHLLRKDVLAEMFTHKAFLPILLATDEYHHLCTVSVLFQKDREGSEGIKVHYIGWPNGCDRIVREIRQWVPSNDGAVLLVDSVAGIQAVHMEDVPRAEEAIKKKRPTIELRLNYHQFHTKVNTRFLQRGTIVDFIDCSEHTVPQVGEAMEKLSLSSAFIRNRGKAILYSEPSPSVTTAENSTSDSCSS
jgi:hypothetical protein